MSRKRTEVPLVAITGASLIHKGDTEAPLRVVRAAYFQLIEKLGGIAVLVNNTRDKEVLNQYVSMFNYLLLTGGGDIDPKYYGDKKDEQTGEKGMTLDQERDESELELVKLFMQAGKPVFGICRGAQIINVALGGTLIQDLPNKGIKHLTPDKEGGWNKKAHEVAFVPGTALEKLSVQLPDGKYMVNTMHHQAVDKLGTGLVVAAKAPDGVVEAIEGDNMAEQFIMAVQWHAEQMRDDALTQMMLRAFLQLS